MRQNESYRAGHVPPVTGASGRIPGFTAAWPAPLHGPRIRCSRGTRAWRPAAYRKDMRSGRPPWQQEPRLVMSSGRPDDSGLAVAGDERADGHTAIVTGANHGIGAAIALALARRGCAVLCTYLRVADPADPGIPQAHRDHRARDAAPVIAQIRAGEGARSRWRPTCRTPRRPALCSTRPRRRSGPGRHPGE